MFLPFYFAFIRKMALPGLNIKRICVAVFCRVSWRKYNDQGRTLNKKLL